MLISYAEKLGRGREAFRWQNTKALQARSKMRDNTVSCESRRFPISSIVACQPCTNDNPTPLRTQIHQVTSVGGVTAATITMKPHVHVHAHYLFESTYLMSPLKKGVKKLAAATLRDLIMQADGAIMSVACHVTAWRFTQNRVGAP